MLLIVGNSQKMSSPESRSVKRPSKQNVVVVSLSPSRYRSALGSQMQSNPAIETPIFFFSQFTQRHTNNFDTTSILQLQKNYPT